jgi:hypothetical protein
MFSEAPFAISYDAQPSPAKPTIAPTRSDPNLSHAAFAANEEAFVLSCIFETKNKSDISHLALHRRRQTLKIIRPKAICSRKARG